MTGYERFTAAINRSRTDRPPFDFWAEDATLNKLFAFLGHNDLEKFLDEMEVDIRGCVAAEPANKYLGGGIYENMWGERFIFRETEWGKVREDTFGALHGAETFDEIEAYAWPDNDCVDYGGLKEKCLSAREKKLAVRYGFADIWQRPGMVRGIENFMTDMILHPEWVRFLSRKFTDFYIEEYRRAFEASGGNIDVFYVISDVGTQKGALISPEMFKSFVASYLFEITEAIHKLGAKVMYHSCGNIYPFIPTIISCGVDIINPIQPTCEEMDPVSLKKFSSELCFHGGIDVQWLLPNGAPDEVKNEVRRYAAVLETGYIACPSHLFQPDTPIENIIAFYKAFE